MTEAASLRRAGPNDLAAVEGLQHRAYARNRDILGVEPLPLLADYAQVFAGYEVWLAERWGALSGVLILEPHDDHLLIWSVAADPAAQGAGTGRQLLAFAETRARELGLRELRLYTGEKLARNVAWYTRHGYAQTSREALPDRVVVHMSKTI